MKQMKRIEVERDPIEFKIQKKIRGTNVAPTVYYQGKILGTTGLIMEQVGPSLSKLLTLFKGKFSYATVCLIAVKQLNNLEIMHKKKCIYGNIHPDKICISIKPNCSNLYFTDFKYGTIQSIADNFLDEDIDKHHNYKKYNVFSSANQLLGGKISKKDDLESLGFLLVFLLKGNFFHNSKNS